MSTQPASAPSSSPAESGSELDEPPVGLAPPAPLAGEGLPEEEPAPAEPILVADTVEPRRTGLQLGLTLGVTRCFQRGCRAQGISPDIRTFPGPVVRLEIGYRIKPVIALMLSGTVSYLPQRPDAEVYVDAEANGAAWSLGPAVYVVPYRRGNFDVFAGLFAGFYQYWTTLEEVRGGGQWGTYNLYTRALIRPGVGFHYYVGEHTVVGIRYDQNIPVGGRRCQSVEPIPSENQFTDRAVCDGWRELQASERDGFPFFWELGVTVAEYFDVVSTSRRRRQRRKESRNR